MDPARFDALTRGLGRAAHPVPTRRTFLATLAASLVAVSGLSTPAAAAKRKKRCRGGTLKCNGGCIDPRTDFDNCGTCGNVCGPGQRCQDGTCVGGGEGGGGGGGGGGGPVASCTGQLDLTNCGGDRRCSGGVCATPPNCGVAPEHCDSALDCCGNVCDPAGHCPLSDPDNPCRTAASCSGGATCVGFVCR